MTQKNERLGQCANTAEPRSSQIPSQEKKMNEHSNTTAAAEVPVRTKLLRAYEVMATARDLNEAIFMACGHMESDIEKNAIQAVVDALAGKLSEALNLIEAAREELA